MRVFEFASIDEVSKGFLTMSYPWINFGLINYIYSFENIF
uniref:Uncharacterized protein n=1 Tax=Lepeophtheirus salmonis TaxID=72036 RepID=A0A0K2V3E1_LEPSM